MRFPIALMVVMITLAVSACSQTGLRDLRPAGTGPDEFLILPNKPLEQPSDFSALPAPTPGGVNRTDTNPKAEAVAALGGAATALDTSNVPSGDGALLTAASRHGVEANVRADLAAEDAKFRRRENRTARFKLFPVDRYKEAYRRQTLDARRTNRIFRNAGAVTPSAPPAE